MIDYEKIIKDLQLIHALSLGANNATKDEESGATFHQICHKIDAIINEVKISAPKKANYGSYGESIGE